MRAIRWWRVDSAPDSFEPVFEAARAAGVRLGWLELDTAVAMPTDLETAAAAGALRAVAVVGGRSVAVKPLAGPPVPRDLLREHFLGCAAVLVRGDVDAEPLTRSAEGWRLGDSAPRSAEELIAALRP